MSKPQSPDGMQAVFDCTEYFVSHVWRRQWDFWRRTGTWPIVWGPDPTASYGCEIPKHLREQWSAEEKAEKEKA